MPYLGSISKQRSLNKYPAQSNIDVNSIVCIYSLRKINPNYKGPAMLVQRYNNNTYPIGNNTFKLIYYDSSGNLDTTTLNNFVNAIGTSFTYATMITLYDQVSPQANLTPVGGTITIVDNNTYVGYINNYSATANVYLTGSSTKISSSITGKISSQHIVGRLLGGYASNGSLLVFAGTQFTRNVPAGTSGYAFFGDGTYPNAAIIDNTTFSPLSTVFKLHSGQVNYNTPITTYSINNGVGFAQNTNSSTIPSSTTIQSNGAIAGVGYDLKEIIIYNKYLTVGEMNTLSSNIISYYGL